MKVSCIVTIFLFLLNSSCIFNKVDEIKTIELVAGDYNHATFKSSHRGIVALNVYLPPSWTINNSEKYPLLILLHGQNGNENSFLNAFPIDSLNRWTEENITSEMVIVSLDGGDYNGDMQWYYDENIELIASEKENSFRKYCFKTFNTTMEHSKISVLGHSRGATGALNFAIKFPSLFDSMVASAFVSDYTIERLKLATDQNLENILDSEIKILMLIGSQDEYVKNNNRNGTKIMSDFFTSRGINHNLEIIKMRGHGTTELWEYPTNLNYLRSICASWQD